MTCSVRAWSRGWAFRPVVIGLMAFFMSALSHSVIAQLLIAFGDSTTAPRSGVPTYADILRGELLLDGGPLEVMNAGVPGNTTAKAMQRFQADVISKAPHTVVILFGINDAAVDAMLGQLDPHSVYIPPRQLQGVNEDLAGRFQGIGVERVFMLHSPQVASISVERRGKVRRAKLFYLRDRGRSEEHTSELQSH